MKRLLIALLCLSLSLSAQAGISTSDITGFNELPEAEKARIIAQIEETSQRIAEEAAAKAKQDVANALPKLPPQMESALSSMGVESTDDLAKLGTSVGDFIVNFAEKLGIATERLMNSFFGKVLVFGAIWMFFGNDLAHLGFGLILFVTVMGLFLWSYRRFFFKRQVVTVTGWRGSEVKKLVWVRGEHRGHHYLLAFAMLAVAMITVLHVMFANGG